MVFKAINDSVGPEGLVSTHPVVGSLPRHGLPTEAPFSSILAHIMALYIAVNGMSKRFALRKMRAALRARNSLDMAIIHT